MSVSNLVFTGYYISLQKTDHLINVDTQVDCTND